MAEVTAMRNNALPYPVYGVAYALVFPILDADGDLVTGAATPDSERSLNGDAFADCTNEVVEIGATGIYYLLLTAAEMTADVIAVQTKSGTVSAKTTVLTLQPRKLVPLRSGTAQGGAVGYITLDAGAGAVNDKWNGCLVVATIDGNVEARIIDDYDGSNQQASVTPDWNVVPDADDTFVIYLPEGMQIPNGEPMRGTDNALLAASYTAPLDAAGTRAAVGLAAANLDAQLGEVPTVAEFEARTLVAASYGTSANQVTILGYIDTEIGAIIASIAALNDLDEAAVRDAVGLAAANLDTQLADLPTVAEFEARTLVAASYATSASQTTIEGKVDVVDANVDTLLARITATLFAGITSLANWLGAMAGKQVADATALTEINATGAGSGTYASTTDSQEAIRDRGDAAWTGGGGGGGGDTTVVTLETSHVEVDTV